MAKLIVITDPHAGATSGLTPPGFMRDDLRDVQFPFWKWFEEHVALYGPYDGLIGLGDFTDGEGKKGTLDTAITDVRKQAQMAAAILRSTGVPTDRMYLVRGTPFHSSGSSEYEDPLADMLPGSSIKNVQRLCIEGWNVHARHVVGRSDIPYGQGTPLLKELARMEHEAFRDSKDAPDIILRGHVHYSAIVGKHGRMAIACPCLQLPTSESNGRRYSAWEYDVGFAVLTLERDREPVYQPVLMEMNIIRSEEYLCVNL